MRNLREVMVKKPMKSPPKAKKTAPTRKRDAPPISAAFPTFDLQTFLDSAGVSRTIAKYGRSAVIFSQGDPATDVLYIQQGRIKLSVLSKAGKEAVIAVLGPGDFFGEGCLAGQPRRMASASALSASTVLVVDKSRMVKLLHNEPA